MSQPTSRPARAVQMMPLPWRTPTAPPARPLRMAVSTMSWPSCASTTPAPSPSWQPSLPRAGSWRPRQSCQRPRVRRPAKQSPRARSTPRRTHCLGSRTRRPRRRLRHLSRWWCLPSSPRRSIPPLSADSGERSPASARPLLRGRTRNPDHHPPGLIHPCRRADRAPITADARLLAPRRGARWLTSPAAIAHGRAVLRPIRRGLLSVRRARMARVGRSDWSWRHGDRSRVRRPDRCAAAGGADAGEIVSPSSSPPGAPPRPTTPWIPQRAPPARRQRLSPAGPCRRGCGATCQARCPLPALSWG